MYCTYCRSKLPDDATFCTSCGMTLSNKPIVQNNNSPKANKSGFGLFGSKKKDAPVPNQQTPPSYLRNPDPAPAPEPVYNPEPSVSYNNPVNESQPFGYGESPAPQPAAPSFAPVEPSVSGPAFSFEPEPAPAAPSGPVFSFEPEPQPEPAAPSGPVFSFEPEPQPEPVEPSGPVFSFEPEPVPQPEPAPAYNFEPEPAPQPEPAPAPSYNFEPEPQPEPAPAPAYNFEPEPAPQPEPVPAPAYNFEPEPQPQPEPVPAPAYSYEPEPQPQPDPAPAPAPAYSYEPEPQPQPEPAPAPAYNFEPEPQPQPEPAPAPAYSYEPEPQPEPAPAPAYNFEPEPVPQPVPEETPTHVTYQSSPFVAPVGQMPDQAPAQNYTQNQMPSQATYTPSEQPAYNPAPQQSPVSPASSGYTGGPGYSGGPAPVGGPNYGGGPAPVGGPNYSGGPAPVGGPNYSGGPAPVGGPNYGGGPAPVGGPNYSGGPSPVGGPNYSGGPSPVGGPSANSGNNYGRGSGYTVGSDRFMAQDYVKPTKKKNGYVLVCSLLGLLTSIATFFGFFEVGGTISKYFDIENISGLNILLTMIEEGSIFDSAADIVLWAIGISLTLCSVLGVLFAFIGLIMYFPASSSARGMVKASFVFTFIWSLISIVIGFIASTASLITLGAVTISLSKLFWIVFTFSAVNLGIHLSSLDASIENERNGALRTPEEVALIKARRYAKNIYALIFGAICVLVCVPCFGLSGSAIITVDELTDVLTSMRVSPLQVLLPLIDEASGASLGYLFLILFAVLVVLELLIIKNCVIIFFKSPSKNNLRKLASHGTRARIELILWSFIIIGITAFVNITYWSELNFKDFSTTAITLGGHVVFLFILACFGLGKMRELMLNVARENYEGANVDSKSVVMLIILSASVVLGYFFVMDYDAYTGYPGFYGFVKTLPFFNKNITMISMVFALFIMFIGIFPLRSYLSYVERMFQANSNFDLRSHINAFSAVNIVLSALLLLYCLFLYIVDERLDLILSYGGFYVLQAAIFCLIISKKMFPNQFDNQKYYDTKSYY